METKLRTLSKAISWQLLGLFTMTAISFWYTGNISSAISLAGSSMLSGIVFYIIHERIWQRIKWGRVIQRKAKESRVKENCVIETR